MDADLEERIAKFEADLARAAEISKQRAAEFRKSLAEIEAALSAGRPRVVAHSPAGQQWGVGHVEVDVVRDFDVSSCCFCAAR